MTIGPGEASEALADIDAMVRKVKQSRGYQVGGAMMILWGAVVIAANLVCAATPRWSGLIWLASDGAGVAASLILLQRGLSNGERLPLRLLTAVLLFFVFGLTWSRLLGHFGPRERDAFWSTFFLFAQSLAGIWFGAIFSLLGLALTGLILAGYLWSGEWFTLWLAAFNGGG